MVKAHPRERFSTDITLTPSEVVAFAAAAGDRNPVHHDDKFAAGTRYGRIIASGAHTSALLMGLSASHFSSRGAMVGLEFWFRFRRPVHADETVHVEWLVVKVTPNARLKGDIVDLRGRIRRLDGQTAVGAKGRVLVTDQL
jgi:3-hydroxybutyryl-CoA dehydratase